MSRFLKYTPYVGIGTGWYLISNLDKTNTKKIAYDKGYNLSQKFKKYPSWDKYMEPFIINQFSFIFGVTNSFIKGLISDNEKNPLLDESLKEMSNEMKELYEKHT